MANLPVLDQLRVIRNIHPNTGSCVFNRQPGVFAHLRVVKLNCK
jgi:DNA replication licensing factor MCM2